MIEAIKQLQEALAYARFEDDEIKRTTENLLNELDRELTSEDYEEGPEVETATSALADALTATDTQKEERVAAEKTAKEEEEFDQFEGLGDEDDEETK